MNRITGGKNHAKEEARSEQSKGWVFGAKTQKGLKEQKRKVIVLPTKAENKQIVIGKEHRKSKYGMRDEMRKNEWKKKWENFTKKKKKRITEGRTHHSGRRTHTEALKITHRSFDNLLLGIIVHPICNFIPIVFLFLIPKEATVVIERRSLDRVQMSTLDVALCQVLGPYPRLALLLFQFLVTVVLSNGYLGSNIRLPQLGFGYRSKIVVSGFNFNVDRWHQPIFLVDMSRVFPLCLVKTHLYPEALAKILEKGKIWMTRRRMGGGEEEVGIGTAAGGRVGPGGVPVEENRLYLRSISSSTIASISSAYTFLKLSNITTTTELPAGKLLLFLLSVVATFSTPPRGYGAGALAEKCGQRREDLGLR
ncbi:hypothetical protein Fmac_011626 [Flemingia macrophylla]|uniref:Uncharacterized protein n=1 Tax=Flemingia macrophylla TaxID=520843 RepID=A0ABD1MMZ6_9FABA